MDAAPADLAERTEPSDATGPSGCGPGRPRSARADRAILAAALDLFAEVGYEGLTIEAVAARAGVARSTVYRRYPGKADLLVAAAARASDERRHVPDTGRLADDMAAVARRLHQMLDESDVGRSVPAAIAAAARHPELAEAHRSMVRRRRDETRAVIERGVARGELPAGVDAELALDLLAAPIFYRTLISREPVDDAYIARLVPTVLAGVTATA